MKKHLLPEPIKALLQAGPIALAAFVLGSGVSAALADTQARGIELAEIVISFKLDPQLTRSLYLGERWVSRAKFSTTLQTGGQVIFEARAVGKTTTGRPTAIDPAWQMADCRIAEVSPARGSAVTIVAAEAGQCQLRVSAGEIVKVLTLDVQAMNGGMQVTVTQ